MSTEFLGVGWAFPVKPGPDGDVALAEHEESVRQSVWIVLGTSPGERVMRPEFGCGLAELVFSAASAQTIGRVENEVRRALTLWEPRIEVVDVQVSPDDEAGSTLLIQITYRVRATNNLFNLVYPFYLAQAGA
jgi:phage baseplate assembly protein W